jgi:hypothetical protein
MAVILGYEGRCDKSPMVHGAAKHTLLCVPVTLRLDERSRVKQARKMTEVQGRPQRTFQPSQAMSGECTGNSYVLPANVDLHDLSLFKST